MESNDNGNSSSSSGIKQMIKNYITIDDQLSQLNKEVKEIRKSKTDLESQIKNYMLDNSIAKVDIGSGTLRISKSKPHKRVNKKIIMDALLDVLDIEKANNIIEDIFNEEDLDEVTKLERSKNK